MPCVGCRTTATAAAAAYEANSIDAYVELHIEQGLDVITLLDIICNDCNIIIIGPVLDNTKLDIGIVTAIVGLWKAEFTLCGQANHAGTTPMNMRRNAFLGLYCMTLFYI